MTAITAALVRELRDITSAGMMDCKKALTEVQGDMDAAIDWLRKKGLSQAAKKSGRVAAEGLVGIACNGTRGAMVEVNAETDFVSRNEAFQQFVEEVAHAALKSGNDLEKLKAEKLKSGRTVADEATHLIATIGENISVRRVAVIDVKSGAVGHYVHNALRPGIGRIGVLIGLEAPSEAEALEDLARQVGMHVAAVKPVSLDRDSIDPTALEHERKIFTEQAKASGKPDDIIAKMVEGRIRKFYQEVVLLEQTWVHDGESRVQDVLSKAGVVLSGFVRYHLGEGIEKQQGDFAAEVAEAAGIK